MYMYMYMYMYTYIYIYTYIHTSALLFSSLLCFTYSFTDRRGPSDSKSSISATAPPPKRHNEHTAQREREPRATPRLPPLPRKTKRRRV